SQLHLVIPRMRGSGQATERSALSPVWGQWTLKASWRCRYLAPNDVAPARPQLFTLDGGALVLRHDHVGERVAADLDEPLCTQQPLDSFARLAHQEGQLVADRRVFGAAPRARRLLLARRDERVAVDHREPSAGPQHALPFADRRLGMWQGPQHMARDHQI